MLSAHWFFDPEYYIKYVARGGKPGQWDGGAALLGLHGTVTAEALRALCKGTTPEGVPLVQFQKGKPHQAGWDFTYSAPKPFGVLWSAAHEPRRENLEGIAAAAVDAGNRCLNRFAAYTRRGKGGRTLEAIELVIARFFHPTSRDNDPQPHEHCLILNVCKRADGSTGTILSLPLYLHKMLAGQAYQNALARGLMLAGYRIRRSEVGFEIVGIPKPLCDEQSKRRKAIEKLLGEKKLSSAKAKQIATLATRKKKDVPSHDELFRAWRETNESYGVTADFVERLSHRHHRLPIGIDNDATAAAKEDALAEAVALAIKNVSEKQSHFAARDIYRAALKETLELGFEVDTVIAAVDQRLEKDLVVVGRRRGYLRYTTRQNLDRERKLLATVDRLKKRSHHVVDKRIIKKGLDRHLPLTPDLSPTDYARNKEQREAIELHMGCAGDFAMTAGGAGTGKGFKQKVQREIGEEAGIIFRGVCVAGATARRLEEASGIKSDTLALFLTKLKHAKVKTDPLHRTKVFVAKPTKAHPQGEVLLSRRHYIVLDEAAMCGTKDLLELIKHVEAAGAKIELVGDRKQLQPIEAGGMRTLEERANTAYLTVITRQHEDPLDPRPQWQREAVKHLAEGNSVDALLLLAERGKVAVLEDREAAKIALVRDWAAESIATPQKHLVLAPTNADVADLNDLCQRARKQQGYLSEKAIVVGEEPIYAGDRILCTHRSRQLKIENGDFGTATGINLYTNTVTVALDRGPTVAIPVNEFPHLRRGYASTVYKSQGATVERASVVVGGSMENLHQSYVECSRHREECRLYTSRWEAGRVLEDLAIQMAQSQEKDLAVDVIRENEKHKGLRSTSYYELPDELPETKLHLEKLERLKEVLLDARREIKPPQKSRKEVQQLLQRLRDSVEDIRKQQDSPQAKVADSPTVNSPLAGAEDIGKHTPHALALSTRNDSASAELSAHSDPSAAAPKATRSEQANIKVPMAPVEQVEELLQRLRSSGVQNIEAPLSHEAPTIEVQDVDSPKIEKRR